VKVVLRSERVELSAGGDLAYAWGSGLTTGGDMERIPAIPGKWMAVYRKRAGAWTIAADTFNDGPEGTL
jgi:ketosteroid isomerase-like protein